jgi:cytosine deaminase
MSAAPDDERHLARALALARLGYAAGGCPIGALLVDPATDTVLGEGHNGLVQEGNPILHGEMVALRAAGRMPNRHRTTMVTTLQPCFMCSGAIAMFGIPRVVIGDVANAGSDETIRFLRARGIEVVVMDPATSPAAAGCVALGAQARRERPDLWLEDWGGGPNPALGARGPG